MKLTAKKYRGLIANNLTDDSTVKTAVKKRFPLYKRDTMKGDLK